MVDEVSKAAVAALRASGKFDAKWYLERYPDVQLLGMDPAEHYLWLGVKLGRMAAAPVKETAASSRTTPRVSVIIPTRNSQQYLTESIDSILGQTFTDFELLIIDDDSSDNTLRILDEYQDPRLIVLQGPDKGLAAALNFGIRQARGEFVARMDADDIAHNARLQKQVEYLDSNPHLGVCGTLFQEFMDGNAIHDHMENVRYTDLLDGCYVGHPTAMFRRTLFVENDLFYNDSLKVSEDYDLWTRAIRITEIGNVPENLLQYRRHGKSASISNVVAQTEHDVGIKVNMIDYLVGGASPEQKKSLGKLFRNESVPKEERERLAIDIIDSIKHSKLCSGLEMVSFLHRLKPFDRAFLRKVTRRTLHDLPIFVISFNHLTHLKSIVQFFQEIGARNVNIIDNNSTYQPLLDYFKIVPYQVHRMGINYGHMALFESLLFKEVIDNSYFVLTDPDILPVAECPEDFLSVFIDILFRHPTKNKVGFSLKIDDLPRHYELRENVIAWESRFYRQELTYEDITIYDAPIDTTFALYRPRREWRTRDFYAALRVGAPYTARHLPWYSDLRSPTDEELFYKTTGSGISNWNGSMSSDELHRKYDTV